MNTFYKIGLLISIFCNQFCFSSYQGASAFTSIFGDYDMSTRNDEISVQFQYGLSMIDTVTTITATGSIQTFTSMVIVSSGTATNGAASITSNSRVAYSPGHEGDAFFTAVFFNGGLANSTQWIGLYDDTDGAAVGYSGTSFGILFRRSNVDVIVTQTNFNVDPLNGSGSSGFTLDPTKINVFRIAYGWLGTAPIIFQIMGTDGQFITFHVIARANTVNAPSFLNPFLPIRAEVKKTSGVGSVSLGTASWNGAVIEQPNTAGNRFFATYNSNTALAVSGETFVMAIRNKTTFNSKPNVIQVNISGFFGGASNDITVSAVMRLRKNSTLSGTAFSNVDADSVVEATTTGSFVDGMVQVTLTAGTYGNGAAPVIFDSQNLVIYLLPGENLTITGESLSGAGVTAAVGLNWQELF